MGLVGGERVSLRSVGGERVKGDLRFPTIEFPENCQNYGISFSAFSISFCPNAFGKSALESP